MLVMGQIESFAVAPRENFPVELKSDILDTLRSFRYDATNYFRTDPVQSLVPGNLEVPAP